MKCKTPPCFCTKWTNGTAAVFNVPTVTRPEAEASSMPFPAFGSQVRTPGGRPAPTGNLTAGAPSSAPGGAGRRSQADGGVAIGRRPGRPAAGSPEPARLRRRVGKPQAPENTQPVPASSSSVRRATTRPRRSSEVPGAVRSATGAAGTPGPPAAARRPSKANQKTWAMGNPQAA